MEIEAKYSVPDDDTLERLARARRLAGYTLGALADRRDGDVFLDTADRRFLAAGYYLRRRETGDGVRLTLKGLVTATDGVLRREELEALVAVDVPVQEWPQGQLRERVESVAQGAPLAPLLELRQRRRTRAVSDGEREVGELSLDEVEIVGDAGERGWLELELELRGEGDEDDLVKLTRALRRRFRLKPESRAKFARALEIAGVDVAAGAAAPAAGAPAAGLAAEVDAEAVAPAAGPESGSAAQAASKAAEGVAAALAEAEPAPGAGEVAGDADATPSSPSPDRAQVRRKRPPIERDDTMALAAVKVLRLHFNKMLAHEKGTRLGDDPEELHDMRVATRRMRMALRIFAPYLDTQEVHPALKGLRRTGRRLGVVRDLDVFKGKAVKYVERLPKRRGGELDGLFAAWDLEYAARRAELIAYLDGRSYRRFVERMAELLEEPPERLSAPGGQGTVAQVLPMLLHRDVADVLGAGALVGPGAPLTRFHELRIAGKALRYTLEFFAAPLGRGALPLIATMKGLQDHLGDLQDAVVASGLVRDYLTHGRWQGPDDAAPAPNTIVVDAGAARYLAARQQEMEDLIAGFPAVWPTIAGEEFGGRLARALARL
ncbi:MAG: CHAD domain-containing protein [Thermoleophilia bacterium]|nr:CHAD domain-containing protein [Thermoleophilia bacterium]